MKFLTRITWLIDYTTQVTECKYFIPIQSYDLLCDIVSFVLTCFVFASLVTYVLSDFYTSCQCTHCLAHIDFLCHTINYNLFIDRNFLHNIDNVFLYNHVRTVLFGIKGMLPYALLTHLSGKVHWGGVQVMMSMQNIHQWSFSLNTCQVCCNHFYCTFCVYVSHVQVRCWHSAVVFFNYTHGDMCWMVIET